MQQPLLDVVAKKLTSADVLQFPGILRGQLGFTGYLSFDSGITDGDGHVYRLGRGLRN